MARAWILLLAAILAWGNEAPVMDPVPALTFAEDEPTASRRLITVTGIAPGPAGESGQAVEVLAASGDTGLLRIDAITYDRAACRATIQLYPIYDANGSTLVFVSLRDDQGGVAVQAVPVTVTAVPDRPVIWWAAAPIHSGETVPLKGLFNFSDGDNPPDSSLVVTIESAAHCGDVLLDGATVLGPGSRFSRADILAGRLGFRHNGAAGWSLDQFNFTLSDGGAISPFTYWFSLILFPGERPQIALPGPAARWVEGGAAVAVCPGALLSDGDSSNFQALELTITSDGDWSEPGDVLAFAHQGDGPGEIAIAGSEVRCAGSRLGTWRGGSDGAALVVACDRPAATPAALQALLRRLTFSHRGSPARPQRAQRRLLATLGDAVSGVSDPAATTLELVFSTIPPRITTTWLGTVAGVPRTLVVAAEGGAGPFTWAVAGQPAIACIDLLDPATGRLRLVPLATDTAVDECTLTVGDGSATVSALVAVTITGPDRARPQALAEPPWQAVAGEELVWELPWDAAVAVAGDGLPAGCTLAASAPRSARLRWTVPVAEPPGLRFFAIFADDAGAHATGRLPVLLRVLPRPGGVQ